jgi:hypothetical protein
MLKTTLAAGVMAAFSIPVLLAQDTSPKNYYPSPDDSAAPVKLPAVMHWCGGGCSAGKGATLVWENGRYVDRTSGVVGGEYTVEKFTRETVIIHRTDHGPYPGKALLTGQLSADGNSIINGTIEWTWHPCCGLGMGTFQAAWGAAINTVPGKNPQQGNPSGPGVGLRNPGMAILMAILGMNPDGSREPADLTQRISDLRNELEAARDKCTHVAPSRDFREAENCQADVNHVQNQLDEAYEDLDQEIEQLEEAQKKLTSECNNGNKQSCNTLGRVRARLDKDKNFR